MAIPPLDPHVGGTGGLLGGVHLSSHPDSHPDRWILRVVHQVAMQTPPEDWHANLLDVVANGMVTLYKA